MMKAELYLDLDGVFADFNARVKLLSGKEPYELERKTLWKIVNYDKGFFANLELIPGSEKLWEVAKRYSPKFLTGAPSAQAFREQKKEWVARIFGAEYETIVLPKKDKQLYSGHYKVLIDDTFVNIEQWISKGGAGILHAGDFDETIKTLEATMALYTTAQDSTHV